MKTAERWRPRAAGPAANHALSAKRRKMSKKRQGRTQDGRTGPAVRGSEITRQGRAISRWMPAKVRAQGLPARTFSGSLSMASLADFWSAKLPVVTTNSGLP